MASDTIEKPPVPVVLSSARPSNELQNREKGASPIDPAPWTEQEEKALVRKIDGIVLSLLMICFFAFQLDRANAGNALTDNFLGDVGITQDQFNIGSQLLNAGIVLLEIPSNIILYRVGPKLWIGCQIIAWSMVATFQAFQKGLGAFLATRLLLGLLESGFIPGSLYTLGCWYKNGELSRRFALFFLGNGIAQACGGLIAYGILRMRGLGGLAGWQWLFLLEGIFTVLSGIAFLCFFPGLPDNPVSLLRISFFTEREAFIAKQRLLRDDATKEAKRGKVDRTSIRRTVSNVQLWFHIVLTIVGLAPTTALWSWAPTIVASFGYGRLEANALVSIGQWISVALIVVAGFAADKTGRRGFIVLFGVFCQWTFMVTFRCLPDSSTGTLKFWILTMGTATCSWWHSVNGSWLSINARSPEERSIRMALFIMAANCAGIVGGQLFRSDDLPFYHRGWSIIAAFMSLGLICVGTLVAMYHFLNRKIAAYNQGQVIEGGSLRVHDSSNDVELGADAALGGGGKGARQIKLYNY
ncbi:alternative sulfate transporter [Microdochium trichocladiopsis]|uniref:Alternative sulfate transporter n=1 Tax=Microdochium trichocladiopsis TaxID=1682393 RepID=A0A9P9BWN0_9PEZI|nr:alternative sulfate transporter [Microdochium trichocladiopsis]KAH7041593.1 alternative sulfate transporter [Microdochium trichocladiopsis]